MRSRAYVVLSGIHHQTARGVVAQERALENRQHEGTPTARQKPQITLERVSEAARIGGSLHDQAGMRPVENRRIRWLRILRKKDVRTHPLVAVRRCEADLLPPVLFSYAGRVEARIERQ